MSETTTTKIRTRRVKQEGEATDMTAEVGQQGEVTEEALPKGETVEPDAHVEPPVEPPVAPNDEQGNAGAGAETTEHEVLHEEKVQMTLNVPHFYRVKNLGAKVLIENVGFGDVYVGVGDFPELRKANRIEPGETRTIEDAETVRFRTSSHPTLIIKEVK